MGAAGQGAICCRDALPAGRCRQGGPCRARRHGRAGRRASGPPGLFAGV